MSIGNAANPMIFRGGKGPRRFDGYAEADVKPGMLVEQTGGGTGIDSDSPGYSPHGTAAGPAIPIFVDSDPFMGTRDTDDDPLEHTLLASENAVVSAGVALRGSYVGARMATGEVFDGTPTMVVSNGDGTVRAAAGDGSEAGGYVGIAVKAADETAGDTLVTIQVI